ncbi:hypothetical protein AB6A40_010876 [Gnathostoma spinigerum]|uniref:Arp2/3 complex 34 kDa subunit n=1 Tax=Gnathostoma spinigerum TaxID=75299 RepID=A0ABD6F379_9BILA
MSQLLRRVYGSHLLNPPESGYNVSIVFDLASLPDDYSSLVAKASLFKRNCFASVFEKYFDFQSSAQQSAKRAVVHYREEETMYAFSGDSKFVFHVLMYKYKVCICIYI